jgi:hypothetical protein
MKQKSRLLALLLSSCAAAVPVIAQSDHATPMAATAPTVVPALVPYAASVSGSDGKPPAGETLMTFELFKDEEGGDPLWVESQTVAVDSTGHYQVQLGASSPSGLPLTTFASGEGRWLEVQIAGQKAAPRVLMTSVPYAMKAADAATLGGLPASAYALAGSTAIAPTSGSASPDAGGAVTTPGGTSGYLPTFTAPLVIGNSIVFEKGSNLGIGTTTPATTLDVNGATTLRGQVSLESAGTATATAGQQSRPLAFFANSYNSSSKAATSPMFEFKAEPTDNNTTSPGATLNLLYTNGGTPGETGLSINSSGILHFATGQTFPGSGSGSGGTITGVTAGTGLTGGGTSGNVTLTVNTSQIPTLTGNNTYTGSNVFAPSLYTNLDMNIDNNNQNSGGISPGLRLGNASGEGMASRRTSGGNQYGLDFFTDYSSRMSINSAGQVSIGTTPTTVAQLAVSGSSDAVLGTTGGSVLHTAGVFGVAGTGNTSGFNGIAGVWGDSSAHVAVLGTSTQYPGVEGYAGNTSGIYGQSNSTSSGDAGVYGNATAGATGIVGISATGIGAIIEGGTPPDSITTAGAGLDVYGGTAADPGGTATAYTGGAAINAYGGYGGNGENGGNGLNAYGGTGTYISGGAGIVTTGGSGSDYGGDGIDAYGGSGSLDSYGISAKPGHGTIAGSFQGDIDVSGKVQTSANVVKIDHPGDPANKLLVHASVESSEMMNIYTGNIVTDELGLATVTLPEWFEQENGDFRYQLTVVGRKAQAWISQEIKGGTFQISSDATSTKVSWQVTAVRQDAYAKANPLVVEQTKATNERGFYMHPELYGQPAEKQTEWGRRPEMMKHMQSVRDAQKSASMPALAGPKSEVAKAAR